MTIKTKLILSTVTVFGIFLITGMTVLLGYRYVTDKASIANEFDKESMYLQMILRGINEVIITEGTPQSIEIAEEGIHGFNRIHEKLLSDMKEPEIHKILTEQIDPTWSNIKKDITPFLEHHLDVESEGLMIKYGKVITQVDEVIKSVKTLSEKIRAVVNANSNKSEIVQKTIILCIISILLLFVILSYQTYRSITMPIRTLMEIAKGFNNGDLSISMDESNNDEFGTLAMHFNRATAKLSTMISQVKSSTDTLVSNSENLSASIAQIAAHTHDQSSQTAHAASATEELNTSFSDVARNTLNAAESAKEATEIASKGGEVVIQTIEGMNLIAQSVRDSATSVETLGESSEKIGEIVKVIGDIAGQTNLLALNAAIEAARAGEQGRGFAVVADEVKKLAEKTASATNEIVDMIHSIQQDTNKVVGNMRSGTREVEEGLELANQAGNSLQQIVTSVQNVTNMIQQIATAAEQQTSTGGEISSNLEAVADLTKQTAHGAQESSEATHNLNNLAHHLQELVRGFKVWNGSNSQSEYQLGGDSAKT